MSPWQPWDTLVPLFPFFWPRQELHFLTPQYILLHCANSSRLLSALAFPVVVQTVWPFKKHFPQNFPYFFIKWCFFISS